MLGAGKAVLRTAGAWGKTGRRNLADMTSASAQTSPEIAQRAERNLMRRGAWTLGGGAAGAMMLGRGRNPVPESSGVNGLRPHSMGGTTMF